MSSAGFSRSCKELGHLGLQDATFVIRQEQESLCSVLLDEHLKVIVSPSSETLAQRELSCTSQCEHRGQLKTG